MENSLLGFKELFDVQLRASYDIAIGEKTIEEGEAIAVFESIQYGNIDEARDYVAATGGYRNAPRVTWESTREVRVNFSQGVFSRIHLALLGNSNLIKVNAIEVPMIEQLTTDEEGLVELRYIPIETTLFVYDETGNKIPKERYVVNDNKVIVSNYLFKNIKIIYDFNYTEETTVLQIGRHWLSGFMELRGKTRLKDDKTGQTITGIISIPKLKLVSDLSIRLGRDVTPVIGNFSTIAFPVGSKGSEKVMDFILLNDDIDSDL